jgi:hypothetical protein
MTLLSPWSLLWLGAAAAVVAVYLLKPRSRRVEVSSTWLWQAALRQESSRSLIQWLKRHLLLLLQVAIALAAVAALARPAAARILPVGRTAVIAIDASAAMLANDGNPTVVEATMGRSGANRTYSRLDEARAVALQALGQLRPGDRVVVLRLADRAEVVAQGLLPGDAADVRSAIGRLPVAPTELDVQEALDVAAAVSRSARVGEVLFITGGALDTGQALRLPGVRVTVATVGKGSADNQAITNLAARRSVSGDLEVFARLRNFGDQTVSGTLHVLVDGQEFQSQPVILDPQGSHEVLLTEFPPTAKIVEARFERPDLLLLDNVATTAVATPLLRKVLLVGSRSEQLERALKAVPGVDLTKVDPQAYNTRGGYDVYVFEGWFPPQPPPGNWVLIDPPRGGAAVTVTDVLGRRSVNGQEVNAAQIARVLPSPLLQGVDLTGIAIGEAKKVSLPDWAEEAVSAREGPLIFTGYPQPYRAVVFTFDLRSSNLFGRIGFPVLISNVVNWLTGELTASSGAVTAPAPGQFVPGDSLLIQPLPRATRVQIETPAKKRYRFDGNQPVRFLDTQRPGAYTVVQYAGNEEIARRTYVASVLQPGREANLADLHPRDTLASIASGAGAGAAAGSAQLTAGPGRELSTSEWWRPIVAIGLLGLVFEWWWFHRT